MQVFCDLPNGARRMCTAYNAYTVVYMLTYIAMMWLYAGLHKLCYPTILLSGGKSPQNGTERVSVTSAKTFFSP